MNMETLRQCKKGHIDTEIIICHRFVDYRDFFFKIWNTEITYAKHCKPTKISHTTFSRALDDGQVKSEYALWKG